MSSNVHQLYQDLYISDMKEEVAAVQGETHNLRLSLLQEKTHKKDLIKENSLIVQKIQIYRRMVGEIPDKKDPKGAKPA